LIYYNNNRANFIKSYFEEGKFDNEEYYDFVVVEFDKIKDIPKNEEINLLF